MAQMIYPDSQASKSSQSVLFCFKNGIVAHRVHTVCIIISQPTAQDKMQNHNAEIFGKVEKWLALI